MKFRYILGVRVDATTYAKATKAVVSWARAKESRYVCVAPVHSIMAAYDSRSYREVLARADMVTPDGMPVVWCLRLLGIAAATRVYGPDLMLHLLRAADKEGLSIGLYGGSPETLDKLCHVLRERYPMLRIAYAWSPPFRTLTDTESAEVVERIRLSGARILFVGLGCPKQERWMYDHRDRIEATMVGVGAAFDFIAGTKKQAPRWMSNHGLEWLFRLLSEPGRLWYRYLKHNPRFLVLFAMQYLGLKRFEKN